MFANFTNKEREIQYGPFKGWYMVNAMRQAPEVSRFTICSLTGGGRNESKENLETARDFNFDIEIDDGDLSKFETFRIFIETKVLDGAVKTAIDFTHKYLTRKIASYTKDMISRAKEQFGEKEYQKMDNKRKASKLGGIAWSCQTNISKNEMPQFVDVPKEFWQNPDIRVKFVAGMFDNLETLYKSSFSIENHFALRDCANDLLTEYANFVSPLLPETEETKNEMNSYKDKQSNFYAKIDKDIKQIQGTLPSNNAKSKND